jgi:hypothetical protein
MTIDIFRRDGGRLHSIHLHSKKTAKKEAEANPALDRHTIVIHFGWPFAMGLGLLLAVAMRHA